MKLPVRVVTDDRRHFIVDADNVCVATCDMLDTAELIVDRINAPHWAHLKSAAEHQRAAAESYALFQHFYATAQYDYATFRAVLTANMYREARLALGMEY